MADQMEVDMIVKAISQGFDKVSKDITDVGKSTETVGRQAEKGSVGIGKMSSAIGLMAGGVVAGAGVALVTFGKQSIAAASNVEEAASKFQAVFGPAAEEAGRALDEFGDAVGRSGYELRETAAGFGAILEGLLGSKQAAAEASITLAKLTTDLSSFYNVSESDAAMALNSALAGQTEPMRKFGVMLSAAAIEAEVFSSGMAKTKDEITNAMKAQATLNIIMESTVTAQGDAARTSDSYANQQRALGAAILDLQVTIGTGLIPTMKTLTAVAIEAAGGLQAFFNVAGNGGDIVQGIVEQNIQQATSVKDLTEQYKRIQAQLGMWGGAAAAITGTQDDLLASSQEVSEAIIMMAKSSEEYVAAAKEMGIVGTAQGQISEEQAAAMYEEAKATIVAAEAQERLAKEASGADAAMLDNVVSTDALSDSSDGTNLALQRMALGYQAAIERSGEFTEKTGQSSEALALLREEAEMVASAFESSFTAALGNTNDAYYTNSVNAEMLNESLYNQIDAQSENAVVTAAAAIALGIYDEAQIATALNAAIIEEKINLLAESFVNGQLTAREMQEQMEAIVNGSPYTTEIETITDEAMGKISGLKDALKNLDGYTVTTHVKVQTDNVPSGGGGNGGGASGGNPGGQAPPSNGGSPGSGGYATGTNGWQTVPAGYPNDSYNVRMQSGEKFAVIPSGQSGAGGMVVNQTFISNTRESQALAWAQAESVRRARLDRV